MSKVNCNIIKDLLPSYMDEICSEETREFVNCHLKECEECRSLIGRMQKTELVAEQSEQRVVDSVKKVKKHIRSIISLGILLGVVGIAMVMFLEQVGMVPVLFYIVIMPVFLIVLSSVLSGYSVTRKRELWNIGFGIAELVLVSYSILLEFLCIIWVKNGVYPFGLEARQLGGFISSQCWISTMIQGGIIAISIWISIKKRSSCRLGINGGILGICINLVFLSLLKRLDTLEGFIQIRNQSLCLILVEWIVMIGVLEWVVWRRKKNL